MYSLFVQSLDSYWNIQSVCNWARKLIHSGDLNGGLLFWFCPFSIIGPLKPFHLLIKTHKTSGRFPGY